MKLYLWHIYVTAIIIITQVTHIHGDLETAQKICPVLTTMKKPLKWSDLDATLLIRAWTGKNDILWKVTKMPNYYDYFEKNDNFCTVLLHGPDCKSSQFVSIPLPADNMEAANFTYNSKTENTARIHYKAEKVHEEYLILKHKIKEIELIDTKSGHVKVDKVHVIPKIVENAFESFYTIVSTHAHWIILRSCDGKATWVRLSSPFLSYNPDSNVLEELLNLKSREEELNDELDELGIDKSTLTTVPLSSPFYPGSV